MKNYSTVCAYKKNAYRYQYGRQANKTLRNIELPDSIPEYVCKHGISPVTTKIKKARPPLTTDTWQEFLFGDLISTICKAKPYKSEDLQESSSTDKHALPYVTRTDENNGVKSFVLGHDDENIELGNAIAIGDTTATISYQKDDFVAGDHIVVVRAHWLNKYTGLFFVSLLRKERYRYSYGRAFKLDEIKNTRLRLPTTMDGKPDYQSMESYIKSPPYSDRI